MKKVGFFCLSLCLVFVFLLLPVSATEAPQMQQSNSSQTLDASKPLLVGAEMIENARSVLLYETNTKTLMYASQPDEQMYPASLVKIMTALLAIEQGTMTDAVTVTAEVLDSVPSDAMTCDLVADEVITLEDLLYCMMVESANDAAAVIADHISGSQEAFVAQMNSKAAELGCTGTNYVNVHGLHNDQQYTTARDTARILEAAMEHELFRTVFGTVKYEVQSTNKSEQRVLTTGNYMLLDEKVQYYDSRVTGGRTGTTELGEQGIAVTAETDSLQMIAIVLGSTTTFAEDGYTTLTVGGFKEISALLDMGMDGFELSQILFANQALKQYDVVNGDCDVIVGPQVSAQTVLPAEITENDLTYRFSDTGNFTAPIEKGAKVSFLEVWYGDICVAQADLYALNSVGLQQDQAQADQNSSDPGSLGTVFVVIGIIIAIAAFVVLLLRFSGKIRVAAMKKRNRRYRRSRRRSQ